MRSLYALDSEPIKKIHDWKIFSPVPLAAFSFRGWFSTQKHFSLL